MCTLLLEMCTCTFCQVSKHAVLGMYQIVIWPDIRQIEQGRIPDIRPLIIAGYRISSWISDIHFAGYPVLKYWISGSKMLDILQEMAGYPVRNCRISGNILPDSYLAIIVKIFFAFNYNKISYFR